MNKTIGFIGLGIMGLPMSLNLLKKSDYSIMGYDVFREKRSIFIGNGGRSPDHVDEIYQNCDIIFLCLPSNNLVKSSIQDIIAKGKKGTIIVDLSSTSPTLIREMYEKAKQVGIRILDSPVSGGESGAIAGTLVMMCGGDQEVFDQVSPLLRYMGSTVTYMGQSGCGSVAKLANNMIVGGYLGAISEGLAFASKAGLDPETLFYAIKDGAAGSSVFDLKAPKMISRNFEASARIAVHQKDLMNAVQLAEELSVEIPMSKMVLDYMNEMEALGKVNEDHCAIVKIYEKNMGVEIKKQQDVRISKN
ncbi:NAD(P)-dependent oxidoreductase [Neobacillus sp. NPDC093127]|uniref:NAD(P)-dependent oxidoreductase n=1 Tax=Neobacillus sp. NPDC093127 TaxID=3364296 RepID=UPI0038107B3B